MPISNSGAMDFLRIESSPLPMMILLDILAIPSGVKSSTNPPMTAQEMMFMKESKLIIPLQMLPHKTFWPSSKETVL